MRHVLVAGPLHPAGLALLDAAEGVSYDLVTSPDPAAYASRIGAAHGLILRMQPLTRPIVAAAPNLEVVSRHGVGYDAVDVSALDERGVLLAIVGDVNSRTVAEHAMMLILAGSRRLVKSANAVRAGDWSHREDLEPREVRDKTLLVIGYGRIGRHLARMAGAFGMHVIAHDPFLQPADFDGATSAHDLDEALDVADMVSIHVPGSDRPVLGQAEFGRLKRGAIVVNTSRGSAIDEAALLAALEDGTVGGACLDVLTQEPPPGNHPLVGHERVIVTPHSAGLTAECARRMAMAAVRNVLDHFDGRLDPAVVVNPARK